MENEQEPKRISLTGTKEEAVDIKFTRFRRRETFFIERFDFGCTLG
jgi:hypothetical protein